MLCFLSDDEEALQVVLRYWSRDESGWRESVKSLAEECGLRQYEFTRHLRSLAVAYDLNLRCAECGFPADVSSRTVYTSSYNHGSLSYSSRYSRQLVCPACADQIAEREQQVAQEAEERKGDMIHEVIAAWVSEEVPELEELDFLDAFYLYAVLLGANEIDSSDDFGPWQDFSIPVAASLSATLEVFRHLFRKRLLIPSFESPVQAFNFDDPAVVASFDPAWVKWQLNMSFWSYPFQTILNTLSSRIDAYCTSILPEDVEALWELVAMSECEGKLQESANYYDFKNFKIGDKTKHALVHALEKFSIPQVWGVIQSATKNSAAFLQTQESKGKRHAMNTIPGNIIRFVDTAIQRNWTVNARTRQHWMIEPTLTSLFFNRLLACHQDGFRTITSVNIREICQTIACSCSS